MPDGMVEQLEFGNVLSRARQCGLLEDYSTRSSDLSALPHDAMR
jgi:hypothetical protein